jgi:phosphoglycolate phosphatase
VMTIGRGGRPVTHAIFDFDGTLSLLRSGWTSVMLQQFLDVVPMQSGDTTEDRSALFGSDIARTTGSPTLHQMQLLAERVIEAGGEHRDPEEYKRDYLRRLQEMMRRRVSAIESGSVAPDAWLVPGSRALLDALTTRGIELVLASGTDEGAVWQEIAILDLDSYFGGRVYGARDNQPSFDKKTVIDRLLANAWIQGAQLAVLGDGPVEIRAAKTVDARAVGVATSDVGTRDGRIDPEKARELGAAGADVIVPDYQCLDVVLAAVLGGR